MFDFELQTDMKSARKEFKNNIASEKDSEFDREWRAARALPRRAFDANEDRCVKARTHRVVIVPTGTTVVGSAARHCRLHVHSTETSQKTHLHPPQPLFAFT